MSNNPGGLFKSSNNTTSNLRNGRLTTLANRMLGIEQPAAATTTNTTTNNNPASDQQQAPPQIVNPIKRNLFGCRLDHEQLHADLQQMLAEQRRVKSAQWSFDFDALRPIESDRVQWRRVRVPIKPSTNSSPTSPTPQERDEQKYLFISGIESDEDDEHDEEDDEALAVPEFYKRQRRFKLAEVDKNRLNVMANQTQQPVQKSATVSNCENNIQANKPVTMSKKTMINPTVVKIIPNPTCVIPSTPVKQPVTTSRSSRKKTTAEFDQLGKILTYSENRKVRIAN